jgi:UDP-galactopyranose mutase
MFEAYTREAKTKRSGLRRRLGTYRYLDMDVTVEETLWASRRVLEAMENGRSLCSRIFR